MPLLLSRDQVVSEVMELARLKISAALKVPYEYVTAQIAVQDGKVVPRFDIPQELVEGMSEDEIKQTMGATWRWLRESLQERLEHIGERRGQR